MYNVIKTKIISPGKVKIYRFYAKNNSLMRDKSINIHPTRSTGRGKSITLFCVISYNNKTPFWNFPNFTYPRRRNTINFTCKTISLLLQSTTLMTSSGKLKNTIYIGLFKNGWYEWMIVYMQKWIEKALLYYPFFSQKSLYILCISINNSSSKRIINSVFSVLFTHV